MAVILRWASADVDPGRRFTGRRQMGVEPTERKDPVEIVPVTIARGLAREGHCPGGSHPA